MATIHFILQGKGGVGKTVIASILVQFFMDTNRDVKAIDTDPVNATLSSYQEYNATRIDILKGDNINPRAFDELLETLFYLPDQIHAVVDNGSSSFVALGSYIKEQAVDTLLIEQGHHVYFHTVVTGGQALDDTLAGLKALADSFPSVPLVVWLNPYFGEIQDKGKTFEQFKIYQNYSNQLHAIIQLPDGNKATIGKDMEDLFRKRITFKTGIASSSSIAVKSRLHRYWQNLMSILEQTGIA